ncbi:hypothetical protein [Sphingomonas astaxanthinifaciens]|uniref:Secreted protein n=1 Tax=Sphingomonas astaxanthinifaciens DSM 22298 TaxID=1123267 RepID=A0ABQ5ZB00_9SPHN|nr:hypothetical protein [Sphingomonas astaxanthinifaciens]GLR48671.1 hypothetical protein GCM10007925_23900 [Sphingomonas astaxanthinifaciens DSM 22298]
MAGPLLSLLLFAQSVAAVPSAPEPEAASAATTDYGPVEPKAPKKKPVTSAASDPCLSQAVEPGVILVCGKRQDYRIDPDVMAARKMVKNQSAPRGPERFVDTSCQVVGPMGCINQPTINVVGAAATAVAVAQALATGGDVGKILQTGHELTEYEIYQLLKREREVEETGSAPPEEGR